MPRHLMRRLGVPIAVTLALVTGAGCTGRGSGDEEPSVVTTRGEAPEATPRKSAIAIEVVDGDTLDVELDGGEIERVRIIGVNAPEAGECYATEATEELRGLVEGEAVGLVKDRSDRDPYGRLLRYVELDGDDVGAALVREGFSVVRVSAPDDAREATLNRLEREARLDERGLWQPDACGPSPGGSRSMEIVELRLDADGDDAQNLNDEWVVVENNGESPVDLSGWRLKDESSSHRYDFPDGFTLGGHDQVRIRSGCGADSGDDLYWCTSGSAIWNNEGDTAFLLDPAGNIVDSRTGS